MCVGPIRVFQAPDGGPISFVEREGMLDLDIPCGRCIECRIAKSRDWSIRNVHESKMHKDSCFLNLTYDDAHYPEDGCVSVEDMQKFMKRLRWEYRPKPLRYFLSAEYGPRTWRAHYHSLIYGLWPSDAKHWSGSGDTRLWNSPTVDRVWGKGRCLFGRVTFESAQYCAGYVIEKVNGDLAPSHYLRPHPLTGELVQLTPPFALMSRKPGIGARFLEKYETDIYPRGEVVLRGGVKLAPPRFYDEWFRKRNPDAAEDMAIVRELRAYERRWDRTTERLAVHREIKESRRRMLFAMRRGLEL